MAVCGVQPHPLHGRVHRAHISGDTDKARRLGQLAGTQAGQREFLVRHRPVVVLVQILELANRHGNDANGVIVATVLARRRPHPQPGSGPVAAAEPLIDSQRVIPTGRPVQLTGHLAHHGQGQIELGHPAWDVELGETSRAHM